MGYEHMLLERQLCFPLYAAAREVTKLYKPLLEASGLTYTQYIVMLALWEYKELTVRDLGEKLYLDSGTLTPVLKRLSTMELIRRSRDLSDERRVVITLTDAGRELQIRMKDVPLQLADRVPLSDDEAKTLHHLLYKLLEEMTASDKELPTTTQTHKSEDLIG